MIIKKRRKKTGEEKKIDTEVLLTVTSDTVVESSSEDNVVDVEVEESSAVSEPEIDLFDIENIDFCCVVSFVYGRNVIGIYAY